MLPRSDHSKHACLFFFKVFPTPCPEHRYAYHINGRTDDFQSKDNTDQHSYYVAELAMVAKRYAELKPDPAAFEKFAKQQQETAYQMMQVSLRAGRHHIYAFDVINILACTAIGRMGSDEP